MEAVDRVYENRYLSGISVILGAVLRITTLTGVVMYLPALVALYYNENYEFRVFFITATVVLAVSLLLIRKLPEPRSLTLGEALFVSGLSWIIVSIIGGIPYVYTIHMSWVDAFFETMSGFTTTGMTLIKIIEGNPYSVLFWRAFTQWLGGAGIIMLFLMIIVSTTKDVSLWRLYTAEARDIRIRASTLGTVKRIWLIYAFYTVLAIIVLKLLGMSWFDSITHSFTALATGGFSTKTASIAAYNSTSIEMALAFFSFMGGINFLAHYLLFTRGVRKFLQYYEVKGAIIIVIAATGLITLDLMYYMGMDPLSSLRYGIFQVISIMTTTGYTSADINMWPSLSKFILLILMFIGGNMCSTGGAIKVGRIIIAVKTVISQLKLMFLPAGTIKPVKVGRETIKNQELIRLFAFFSAYMTTMVIGTLILTMYGYDVFQSLSAVASAQGNVGPCYMDLFILNNPSKIVLALLMWIGRLEVIPAIAIFLPLSWRHVISRKMR